MRREELTISEVMYLASEITIENGFRTNCGKHITTDIALIHSELSEALEEVRNDNPIAAVYVKDGKPEGFPIEMADCIIRICEVCNHHDVDLEAAIIQKLEYNKNRSYKHGGKLF